VHKELRVDRTTLGQVARWYYEAEMSQSAISVRLGVSRSTVSRLLGEARRTGVLQIIVREDMTDRHADLARGIESRFGLEKVLVAESSGDSTIQSVGLIAAREVERRIHPGGTLAISYGVAVHATVAALRTRQVESMTAVQIAAVEGVRNPVVDGWELVRLCASRFGARYHYLPGPLMANSSELKTQLLQEAGVESCLRYARQADVAIVGVGSMDPRYSSLVRAGHLTPAELKAHEDAGSVGYIAAQHYDRSGRPLDSLNRLTMSLDLRTIKSLPCVVAVATGTHKVNSLKGALAGGYITILVTDSHTAIDLIR